MRVKGELKVHFAHAIRGPKIDEKSYRMIKTEKVRTWDSF